MKRLLTTVALGAILAATGLSAVGHADDHKLKFVFVSFAPDSDSWWNVIKNALKVTGDQMGVETQYKNPPTGDMSEMVRIIEQATAAKVDGLIIADADPNILKAPIAAAIASGIPVVTANSGTVEQSQALGALLHVGQPEHEAGLRAGMRAKEHGAKKFVCVNHYIVNPSSVERCQGFADGLGVKLDRQMIDSGMDPTEIKNKVEAYLKTNPDTDSIITLGPNSAAPTIVAVKELGLAGSIYFGTFDLSSEIADGLKDGTISYAIDQQPFLQGSIPVQVLANYVRYGISPANSILSGPSFVTKETVDQVLKMAGTYR